MAPNTSSTALISIQALLQRTFRERRSLLRALFLPYTPEYIGSARFALVESIDSEEGRASVEGFWQRSVESQCEGVMIKVRITYCL